MIMLQLWRISREKDKVETEKYVEPVKEIVLWPLPLDQFM